MLQSPSYVLEYERVFRRDLHSPSYVLEYEQQVFRRDLHVRFHSADSDSDHIRTYLWPALLQGPGASLTTFPDRRLMLQSPSYVLEYEQRVFRRDLHVRFHSADSDSDHIRTYLWPALLQGPGACLTTSPDRRLMLQSPSYVLEYEQRVFRRDLHVRFHSADSDSDHIRTYLWPALLQGPGGQCVHKAVVIT
ncbi:hypothetical protein J6590_090976 [Homalodisca vitripennis]|nr:hypothetical protein J6590_090976 [Homalodisca vitripennis]